MIASVRFATAFALSISALAVFPQQPRAQSSLAEMQSAMLGDWVLTFLNPGSGRARLTITNVSQNSNGSFQIFGMYAYGDNQTAALKSGELTQFGGASQLNLTTARGALLVAKSQGEGGFQGESTPVKGPKNPFRMEKAEGQSVAVAASAQDSVNALGMAKVKQAIESSPVKRPFIEAGDCWSYRWTYLSTKDKPVSDHTLCVTYVDYSKDVIVAVSSMGGDGTNHTFTTEWNPVTSHHTVRRSTTHFMKFPLHVGDTYSFNTNYQVRDTPEQQRDAKWHMKVVGWEDVTVPAGTFRAVRIEGIGIRKSGRKKSQLTMWYVPEVNREVKRISENSARTVVYELTQYRLAK